jgi:hypothetical protein
LHGLGDELRSVVRAKALGNAAQDEQVGEHIDDVDGFEFPIDPDRQAFDESLDPDENPAKEGRYRYTAAHEVGHWRLHRGLFGKDPAQTSLLDPNAPPSVICRTSQAKARIELQADLYASCVLMPRKLVFVAWDEAFPDRKQRVLQPSEPINHSFVELARFESRIPGAAFTESDDQALESFAKPFAEKFLVSPIAMRIRLEKLGLLHRTVPLQRLLSDGS